MLLNRVLKDAKIYTDNLAKATVLNCNNVADYFYLSNDQEYWNLQTDFPNIAPPWNNMWFEWSVPKMVNSNVYGFKENPDGRIFSRTGVHIMIRKVEEFTFDNTQREVLLKNFVRTFVANEFQTRGYDYSKNKKIADQRMELLYKKAKNDGIILKELNDEFDKQLIRMKNDGAYWTFTARTYAEPHKGPIEQIKATVQAYITKEGKYLGIDGGKRFNVIPDIYLTGPKAQHFADSLGGFLHIPFMTLCFCHCKNIELTEHKLTEGKLSQKKKNKLKAAYRYYVLNIEPMKNILKYEGESEKTGLKKALHICRGHFATYTPDAPLFGRVTGTFWKPMHVRGNKKEGVVIKDYKIKTPEIIHG